MMGNSIFGEIVVGDRTAETLAVAAVRSALRSKKLKLNGMCKGIIKMLVSYIDQAMELAIYEIIEDDGTYWGEIPPFAGSMGAARDTRRCGA